MATVGDHLSIVRNLIKQVQDDSQYTDSMLHSMLIKSSSLLLKQKSEKRHKISDYLYRSFCMELVTTLTHDCSCIPHGCPALRTRYETPVVVTARDRDLIQVSDLSGRLIPRRTEQQILSDELDPIRKNKPAWFIKNKYVYLVNADYKVIQLKGLWEDLSQWVGIEYCPDGDCYNIYEDDFPLDEDLSIQCYQIMLSLLQVPLQIQGDSTVDSNPQIVS